ncbi:MAG: DUF4139 domain-containing protein [Deltaproteobacteria bacterium]
MKRILYFLVLLSAFNLKAEELKIKSQIEKVTVFRNGAQIVRSANVSFKPGINELVMTNLPLGFNESTINVKLTPNLDINSVSFRKNYADDLIQNPEYNALKVKYDGLLLKKENEQMVYDTWKEEENLILANKKIGGENSGLNPDQLIKIADIYRSRLLEVKQRMTESSRKLKDFDKELQKLSSQMKEISSRQANQVMAEIIIVVSSVNSVNEKIEISYIDPRASWLTSFDLKLESLQKPLNLLYKGRISQNTGEDWTGVNIKLSTGNPQSNIQFPEIKPWFLYYYEDNYYKGNAVQMKSLPVQARMEDNVRAEINVDLGVTANENITFMEFSIPGKMTIPSDNKEHEVKLKENEIPAQFEYIAIPKQDNNIYLKANIIDWDQYNISSGEVKLYFEGTFTGTSYIDANLTGDTMSISLGPDIAIAAKREKLKDLKKSSIFSNKRNIQQGFEISIKNNKPVSVDLTLLDQIPISTDSEMEISPDELSGGKLNKESGIIEWRILLKPGEQVKKRFAFTAKIPKDKKINL